MQGQLNTIVKESSSVDLSAKGRQKEGIEIQETSSLTWVEAIGHKGWTGTTCGQNQGGRRPKSKMSKVPDNYTKNKNTS